MINRDFLRSIWEKPLLAPTERNTERSAERSHGEESAVAERTEPVDAGYQPKYELPKYQLPKEAGVK